MLSQAPACPETLTTEARKRLQEIRARADEVTHATGLDVEVRVRTTTHGDLFEVYVNGRFMDCDYEAPRLRSGLLSTWLGYELAREQADAI